MSRTNMRSTAMGGRMAAAVLACGCIGLAHGQTAADSYPTKPVTLVIPFAPGSTTETDARPMLHHLTGVFGKPFLTDFRPGAGGTTGNHHVARAAPDGHTLLIVTTSFATNFALRDALPYAPKDFAPVSLLSRRSVILVVTPTLPVQNFAEYLAYAKAHPGKLNWGTSGVGSIFHMAGAYLASTTGTQVTFIHYKGNAQGFIDLVAGRTQVSPMTTYAAQPYLKSGKVRPIAHLSAGRSRFLPDLPSVAELGATGYDYSGWGAILTTAGAPPAVVSRLSAAIVAYTRTPEAAARALREGYELEGSTPEALGKLIQGEIARWKKVATDHGIKAGEE